ncbi:MAG: DegT/DnrJ/EryC1/StrS family aminotransferase [Acidobacteriota bacterium]|nr:DegT/DnrJ/EryC1/StrS family aminotransferase [Acidobacteriota bacterium]
MNHLQAALAATEPEWRRNLERLFARGQFILGEQVAEFEQAFARAMGARYAVGVASGTAALELCLREAGITGEVLTSPLTAPFTGLAILAAGATPRFADVDQETLLLDPRNAPAAAAVMPVHLYGNTAGMEPYGVPIIQDACQAHGALHQGRPLADYSSHVAYSFYPTKNLGCLGDGGAVVTNDAGIAQRIARLRDGARIENHVAIAAGINARLDEIQCCFLNAFLPHLAEWNARRAHLARLYDEALGGRVRIVPRSQGSVQHLYVIRSTQRDVFRERLAARGVATGVHYPVPLHLHPAFSHCGSKAGDHPHAEQAAKEVVCLPLDPFMQEAEVLLVAELVLEAWA